jgi:membrane protein YdbS with pleckstrin-like domain
VSAAARPRLGWLRRVLLLSASTLCAINIWTGAPLFAVWVGSQAASGSQASMGAVAVVVVVLFVTGFALTMALSWLSARYDKLTGRPVESRRTSPWLRSMRGEREETARRRHGVSAVERIVVIAVVLAALAFEVWFFFFAGSSLPAQ